MRLNAEGVAHFGPFRRISVFRPAFRPSFRPAFRFFGPHFGPHFGSHLRPKCGPQCDPQLCPCVPQLRDGFPPNPAEMRPRCGGNCGRLQKVGPEQKVGRPFLVFFMTGVQKKNAERAFWNAGNLVV